MNEQQKAHHEETLRILETKLRNYGWNIAETVPPEPINFCKWYAYIKSQSPVVCTHNNEAPNFILQPNIFIYKQEIQELTFELSLRAKTNYEFWVDFKMWPITPSDFFRLWPLHQAQLIRAWEAANE